MKVKNILFIFCLLCSFTVFAQNKNMTKFFDKYENEDDVTIVNISKAMFSMMPAVNIKTEGADISPILSKIESMRIITSGNKNLKEKMAAESKALVTKDNNYEELMRVKNNKNNVIFNAIKNGNLIKELLMLVNSDDNFVAIQILGNFTVGDIQQITKNSDKQ